MATLYQLDWLTNKIKDFIEEDVASEWWGQGKEYFLKYLSFSEEMDFGPVNDVVLVNSLHEDFHSLQTCSEFSSLTRHKKILIARKRLWLLLRHFKDEDRNLILNEKDHGFLSIFEEQTVFKFQYHKTENAYIEKFREKDEMVKKSK